MAVTHHDYINFLMQLAKKIVYGKAKLINVKKKYETDRKREFTHLKSKEENRILCCFVVQ